MSEDHDSAQSVLVEKRGRILIVTINRPRAKNAIDAAVSQALADSMDQLDDELFRRFFRRAAGNGKLSDLWSEVEKRHPDGEPEKNPFKEGR